MMRHLVLLLVVVAVAAAFVAGCSKPKTIATPVPKNPGGVPVATTEVKAFIPCGMIIPMRAVADAFMAKHPEIKVTGIYDNGGIIVKRIVEKGEQADLVVSPGSTELARIEKAGFLDPGTAKPVGDFELVVIVPANSKLELKSPADLKKCKTIGMPDPEINSVGTSGREALTKLGLYDTLKPKMLLPKHAIEAHTMVAAGKADASISYKNCPLETNPEKLSKSKVRVAFSFPADSYTKQQCLVAPLKAGISPDAARLYLDFLTSEEGLKILADNGMTGCLDLCETGEKTGAAAKPAAGAPAKKAAIHVVAYYPDTEGHAHIKKMILGLPAKFGPKVSSEFVDFGDDGEGFKRWQAAGLNCGAIMINDQQTWTYTKGSENVEVTFKMAMGGEWTEEDLNAVLAKLVKETK